jgi:hypothetical protein
LNYTRAGSPNSEAIQEAPYPWVIPNDKKMVEGGGFEPPKAEPSDLQSDPFGRSGTPPKKDVHCLHRLIECQQSAQNIWEDMSELARGIEPPTH